MPEPILPASADNPIGGTRLITEARKAIDKQLRETQRWLLGTLANINTTRITINSSVYEYQISPFGLQSVVTELVRRLEDPQPGANVLVNRVVAGYEIGTAAEITNLATLTTDYTRTVTSVLTSDPWQRRVALIRARVFEQMQGFGGETAADLARVLSTGIENGKNPLAVAKDLRARFDVSRSRAERIARTEITGALRRAKLDEAEDARVNIGIRTLEMHLSALSPTTRASHAARHGRLFTVQEVREWYTQDGNGINCKCNVVSVLVDADNNPLSTRSIDRAIAARVRFDANG